MNTDNDATFDSANYSYADVPSPYWFEYLWGDGESLLGSQSEEVN